MGFALEDLIRSRPFAFHTSHAANVQAIRQSGMLRSTCGLLSGTRHAYLLSTRRPASVLVELSGEQLLVPDNRPLVPRNLALPEGCSLVDWLRELNSRVFFWPGWERGPVKSGRLHFHRYAAEGQAFTIRMSMASLLAANSHRDLWVTRCNSGSARQQHGKPVRRGPETFQRPEAALFRPTAVIELTYVAQSCLRTLNGRHPSTVRGRACGIRSRNRWGYDPLSASPCPPVRCPLRWISPSPTVRFRSSPTPSAVAPWNPAPN